jgi:hypothetical protein
MTDRTSTTPPNGTTPAPDERLLLQHSVTADLRQMMDETMDAFGIRREPSAPTMFLGAPAINAAGSHAPRRPEHGEA